MKFVTTTALALAAAAIASPVYAQSAPAATPAPAKINISAKAAKAFVALQAAVDANDVASIPAKVAAANAAAQTKDDRYGIAQLQLKAALAAKDDNATVAAIDAIAASGFLDATRTAELYYSLGGQFFNAKNYARAETQFERAASLNPRDPEALKMLSEVRRVTGRKTEAADMLLKAMALSTAAGQKPAESLYKQAAALAYEAKAANAAELSRQWVAAYPNPTSWSDSVSIYRSLSQPGVGQTLDLLRLLRATGALTTSGQYSLYATAAAEQGNFGEAQAVLEEGIATSRVTVTDAVVRDTLKGLKTKPKPTAADLVAAAKMSPTGASLLRIGDRYYGIGDYAGAATTYRAAMAKGGADSNLVNLHLGMALARGGDKAGATAALNAVGGSQAEIAKYWLLYVNRSA